MAGHFCLGVSQGTAGGRQGGSDRGWRIHFHVANPRDWQISWCWWLAGSSVPPHVGLHGGCLSVPAVWRPACPVYHPGDHTEATECFSSPAPEATECCFGRIPPTTGSALLGGEGKNTGCKIL